MSLRAFLLALLLTTILKPPGQAFAQETPVVRGVLFFSPTCPHCHHVIEETLPPLQAQYGDQLQILLVDVTQTQGAELYQAAVTTLAIPPDRFGVPTLIIGDTVLVGSQEIPDQLPGLIEMYLEDGGVGWPPIPGMEANLPLLPASTPVNEFPEAIVRAVLFHSPTCSFCRQIVEEQLPPITASYGDQLEILFVDVNTPAGEALYQDVVEEFELSGGVPVLIIGDDILGGVNIPTQLPGLVENYLADGGADWPAIPGLMAFLETAPLTAPSTATPVPTSEPCNTCGEVSANPAVRAVLFWMDGCPHCHEVLDKVLPPLEAKYGSQLDIQLIEIVTSDDVDRLYQLAASFGLTKEQVMVPLLIIGDQALVGAEQIPAELPGLIETHLAAGGVEIRNQQALDELRFPISTRDPDIRVTEPFTPGSTQPVTENQPASGSSRVIVTPNGFWLAIGILLGMAAALVFAGVMIVRAWHGMALRRLPHRLDLAIPLLALIGLGVAGYLTYVETQAVSAVCGPIGDCNSVQSSEYAKLFGVLPIGVLGVFGQIAILATWLWGRLRSDRLADIAPLVVFGLTVFGTFFSVYLTYLEPFVIRAVCAWCLTSAVIMTALMLISLYPAAEALQAD